MRLERLDELIGDEESRRTRAVGRPRQRARARHVHVTKTTCTRHAMHGPGPHACRKSTMRIVQVQGPLHVDTRRETLLIDFSWCLYAIYGQSQIASQDPGWLRPGSPSTHLALSVSRAYGNGT